LRLLRVKSFDLILERLYFVMTDLFKTFFFVFSVLVSLAVLNLHLFSGFLKYRCMKLSTGFLEENGVCGNYRCGVDETCVKSLDNLDNGVSNYDNIFSSLIQLFKIITFNNWTDSLYVIQKSFTNYIFLFFLLLIVLGNFVVLNLILAILKVKYSEGVTKISHLNKTTFKVYDFKKIKKFTLMLGQKIDSGLFESMNKSSNFMKAFYSLRFSQIKMNRYSQLKKDDLKKKNHLNFLMKIVDKYVLFDYFRNKKDESKNPLNALKYKYLELIVDSKMKYNSNSLSDVLLEK